MVSRRHFMSGAGLAIVASSPWLKRASARAAQEREVEPASIVHERFLNMLRFIPREVGRNALTGDGSPFEYADFLARFEALAMEWPPESSDVSWDAPSLLALRPMLVESEISRTVLGVEARDVFGWDLFQVHQTLALFGPSGRVRIIRGDFDAASLEAAWAANGYERIERDGHVIHSIDSEPTLFLETEVGRLGLGTLNNVGQVGDVLVYSGELEVLVAMLDAGLGNAPSVADMPGISQLLDGAPGPLASALVLSAAELTNVEASDPESDDPLLAIVAYLSGSQVFDPLVAHSTTDARMSVAAQYPDAAMALETAKFAAIRLEADDLASVEGTYMRLLAGWRIDADLERSIVHVEADLRPEYETAWFDLVFRRDLRFLMAPEFGE
jgi:hypothetical protein